ncbi:MAG TPA: cytochrome c3 family protein [bacterium]|jgi:hypothetical protein
MRNPFWLFGILAFWFLAPSASAQISPGKLSRYHSALEGISNCTKCHALGQDVANSKCLDCHTQIAARQSAGTGYHTSSAVKSAKCASCHSEHNGVDFELVNWKGGKKVFDHTLTGFALDGAHRNKECSDCHRGSFVADNAVKSGRNVNLTRTFLGLGKECTSCHENEHQGQLAENCLKCHTTDAWKPAGGYSHSQAKYALTGKHVSTDCEKCHPFQSVPLATSDKISKKDHVGQYARYTGLSFANCTPCHEDKHTGQFGQNCGTCHVTASFKTIVGTAFDHSKTKYQLEGRHRDVTCTKCHTSGDMTTPVAHAACVNCHKDEHGGQFAARKDKGVCDACHTMAGYTPPKYGIDEHAQSRLALTGSHLAVPCSQCHTKATPQSPAKFTFEDRSCKGCHKDAHDGQLDLWIAKGGCEFCHNTDTWHRTSFDHKLAKFPLEGKHREVLCLKCHKVVKPGDKEVLWIKPLAMDCASCHKDPHAGQFVRADRNEKQADCKRCHSPQGWKETVFAHSRDARFKLDGAHEKVACSACHPSVKGADGNAYVVYSPLKMECSACHAGKRAS